MDRTFPILILLSILWNGGCRPMPPPQTPSSDQSLLPFYTPTPSETPEQPAALDVPETPLPSATPFSYEVKAGDTLSGIALKFGVSLDDLAAENPDVSPNSMSIGTTLRIPSGRANPSSAGTPTPVPVPVKQVECYPSADQGLGCFVLVFNDSDASLENLSAQVSLLDTGGTSVANAIAILPLNILPPGSALPLVVFFPPVIPADTRPLVQLQTGIRLLPDDARYLPATISNTLVQVEGSGRIAQVNGSVYLPDGARQANLVWVAAVAYDGSGRVVGVKRWESNGGVAPGGSLPFAFSISSMAGEIEHVEWVVEARP